MDLGTRNVLPARTAAPLLSTVRLCIKGCGCPLQPRAPGAPDATELSSNLRIRIPLPPFDAQGPPGHCRRARRGTKPTPAAMTRNILNGWTLMCSPAGLVVSSEPLAPLLHSIVSHRHLLPLPIDTPPCTSCERMIRTGGTRGAVRDRSSRVRTEYRATRFLVPRSGAYCR
jgi:hypothetical protein